jgi:hypothetical protein
LKSEYEKGDTGFYTSIPLLVPGTGLEPARPLWVKGF